MVLLMPVCSFENLEMNLVILLILIMLVFTISGCVVKLERKFAGYRCFVYSWLVY